MRKIYSFLIIFLCVFTLTSCSTDLESKRFEVIEENLKTENVVEKYNKTMDNIEDFNVLFETSVRVSINTDNTELNNYGFTVTSYIDSIKEKVSENLEIVRQQYNIEVTEEDVYEKIEMEFIPFFISETGEIEEYIFINSEHIAITLVVYWNNGEIEDIVFQ